MIAFKPVEKPFMTKLVHSTIFQVVALALIVITVFSFARQAHRRELADRQADIENAQNSQVVVNRTSETTKSEFASASAPVSPASVPAAGAGGSQPANPSAGAAPGALSSEPTSLAAYDPNNSAPIVNNPDRAAGSATAATGSAPGANLSRPTSLSISFVEMPRASASELVALADRRNSQLQGSFNTGIVPGLAAKLKTLPGIEKMDSSDRGMKLAETVEFYGGQREETTGHFLGYVVEAVPTQMDENETHLQVRVFRYLRDTGGQVEEFAVPMPDQLNIPRGGGAFISGSYLLPRRTGETDRQFYDPLKVLHILAKDDYLKGVSEFVILIEPR